MPVLTYVADASLAQWEGMCHPLSVSDHLCHIKGDLTQLHDAGVKNEISVARVSARLELGSSADSLVWSGLADPYTV